MAAPVRNFAPKKVGPAPRVPFTFTFLRGDNPEEHAFLAVARFDAAGLARTMETAKADPEKAVAGVLKSIRKMLDDSDGVPARWSPDPLPPRPAPPTASGPAYGEWPADPREADRIQAAAESEARVFRAPDGTLCPMDLAPKYLDASAGSSRRRWQLLIDSDDDDLTVDTEALMALFEWMVAQASNRPTLPSA